MGKVVITVDMQHDFVDGELGTKEAREIVPRIAEKLLEYEKEDYNSRPYIIFTQDTHGLGYLETFEGKHLPVVHCVKNTPGWCIVDELFPHALYVIEKKTFGYSRWYDVINDYMKRSRGKTEIEIFGVCTDICVISNALVLHTLFPEIPITVDASRCAGTTPEKHKAALEVMKSCQINVINEEGE